MQKNQPPPLELMKNPTPPQANILYIQIQLFLCGMFANEA